MFSPAVNMMYAKLQRRRDGCANKPCNFSKPNDFVETDNEIADKNTRTVNNNLGDPLLSVAPAQWFVKHPTAVPSKRKQQYPGKLKIPSLLADKASILSP
jgi:hypothetical protein